jgi:GNAT superfamily N-acetyltransferase
MVTPDESIRRATQAEALPVADLLLRSRHATAGIPPGPFSDDEIRTWFREVAMPSSREVWVMARGDTLTAMMVLNAQWLEQLFVAPEHLRDGRGSQLLRLAQSSRSELELWVFEANAPAIAFYEKHGFRAVGPASSENQEQAQAICYRWTREAPKP